MIPSYTALWKEVQELRQSVRDTHQADDRVGKAAKELLAKLEPFLGTDYASDPPEIDDLRKAAAALRDLL